MLWHEVFKRDVLLDYGDVIFAADAVIRCQTSDLANGLSKAIHFGRQGTMWAATHGF